MPAEASIAARIIATMMPTSAMPVSGELTPSTNGTNIAPNVPIMNTSECAKLMSRSTPYTMV